MVRSLFAAAAVALAGLATLASAQSFYADFGLDTGNTLTFADPVSSLGIVTGTLDQGKAACDDIVNCIAVLYQQSVGASRLLRYDANGSTESAAGYNSVSWRYDAPSRPTCSSSDAGFVGSGGLCICDNESDVQDTNFGCRAAAVPSGVIERRARRMSRNHIMPGRPAVASF